MSLPRTAIFREVIKRAAVAKENKEIPLDAAFVAQRPFVEDPSRFISAQCSRRAGKTNGLAIRFFKTLAKYPKSQCVYLGLTLDSARDIFWPVLQELNDRYGLGCKFTDSTLTMKSPNGATLKLYGADMKNFIKRLKGRKYPGVGIDESQDFGIHLQSLVDDVLTPAIADYTDGWLALTGTPGPVPQGYFFDITQNKKYGFSHHEWTLYENPFMPNPQVFVEDLKAKREWLNDNPTLQREYLNKWVLDVESLWIKYNVTCNYTELPDIKWNYILGVDIGYNDADAIAVIAWSEESKQTYLVEEIIKPKQGVTALFEMIAAAQKKYDAYKIVMDEGALGKKIAEDLIPRFQVPFVAADKSKKQTNVELLNDDLRLGRFKAKINSRFAKDSYLVQIDWDHTTPNKIVIKKKPHSDIIDAVLYAFKDSYAFTHKPAVLGPVYGSKEWAELQTNSMFEKEMEGYMQENEPESRYNKWLKGE